MASAPTTAITAFPVVNPGIIKAWRANPLTISATLPEDMTRLAGTEYILLEITAAEDGGKTRLGQARIDGPFTAGQALDFDLESADLNIPIPEGKASRVVNFSVTAYSEADQRLVSLLLGRIELFDNGTTQGFPDDPSFPPYASFNHTHSAATPDASGLMTAAQAAALVEATEGVAENSASITTAQGQISANASAITAEASARAAADAAEGVTRGQQVAELAADITALQEGQASGRVAYQTLAELNADLAHPVNTPAEVTNDPEPTNIGAYIKVGGSGTGSWLKSPNDTPARLAAQESKTSTFAVVSGLFYEGVKQVLSLVARDRMSPFTVGADGLTRLLKVAIEGGSAVLQSLTAAGLACRSIATTPGWSFLYRARDGKVAIGLRNDGTGSWPGLDPNPLPAGHVGTSALAANAVTSAKLDLSLRRGTAVDYALTAPDDVRAQLATVGVWYNNQWQPMPRCVTPALFGLNNSGNTVDFRPSSGLMIRGIRRVGTFDPGAVGSVTYKGELRSSTTWPPSGSFVTGDYYVYTSTSSRVIGSDTFRLGDNAVYNGSAWVLQAGPGAGVARVPQDWWALSAGGTFGGVTYATGDRILYLGYQSESGVGFEIFRKGSTADAGEFYRNGTFNPASGYPASPVDGDVWLASAAGTVSGGLTFAIGDTLFRWAGAWGKAATGTIQSFASGALIHLPCLSGNAGEWEVRRGDGGTTLIGLTLTGRGVPVRYRTTNNILVVGDSMAQFPGPAIAALQTGRIVTTKSWGGGTARNIVSALEGMVYAGTVLGDTVVTFIGQNSAGFIGQNMWARQRVAELMGAADRRVIHMSMLGQRDFTFNGTRLVCANFEEQLVAGSTNTYARDVQALRATWPDQWVWAAKSLCDAAASDTEPSIQFPGMTNAQVAATYGIPPLKWCRSFDLTGVTVGSLNFLGYHSAAGLPTGGNNNDYYLRTGNGTVGNPIFKIGGSWVERTFDAIHLNAAGDAIQGATLSAAITAKNW